MSSPDETTGNTYIDKLLRDLRGRETELWAELTEITDAIERLGGTPADRPTNEPEPFTETDKFHQASESVDKPKKKAMPTEEELANRLRGLLKLLRDRFQGEWVAVPDIRTASNGAYNTGNDAADRQRLLHDTNTLMEAGRVEKQSRRGNGGNLYRLVPVANEGERVSQIVWP